MNEKEAKLSEQISTFLKLIDATEQAYPYIEEQLTTQDKLTQDYLHQLELENLKYKDRAKVATQLSLNRKKRRAYKDSLEEIQPIIDYISNNKKVINDLKRLLGEVRKQEKKHTNRKYFPKVMDFATYKQED